MKKTGLLAGLLLLLVLLYWGMNHGWFKGNYSERRDFAITDSAGLDKIYLADKSGRHLLLEKIQGTWMVNGLYEANQGWLKQLLHTITKVRVKSPVPKKGVNAVIKNLATSHIKVELYVKGDLQKVYFVGGGTQDDLGTYMWIENSEVPFICEVPGFQGVLTPQFSLNEQVWRSRKIFGLNPETIQEIEVTYHDSIKKGFKVLLEGAALKVFQGPQLLNPIDSMFVKYYVGLYREVHAEAFGMLYQNEKPDSLRKLPWWCQIKVRSTSGKKYLEIYQMPVNARTKQQFNTEGNALLVDPERYYAFADGTQDVMIIQDYVFAPLLRTAQDFLKK
jgi:hypothetical protein